MIIAFIGLNSNASGQNAKAVARAEATIIQPVNLLKVRDLNFGFISSGETSGVVVLAPTEAGSRTVSGGVSLPSGTGPVKSAKFIVSGSKGNSFSIILPTNPIVLSNGSAFMTLDNFTSSPSGSGTFTSGSQTICVGATLNVNANQQPGLYKSTEQFEIIVSYD